MGRSDFTPLAVPAWEEEAPINAVTPVNSISDFLGRRAAFTAQSTQPSDSGQLSTDNEPSPPSSRDQVASQPERCPHCSAGLSALDLKFERCLRCGKSFGAAAAAQDGRNQPVLVHNI